jgi:glutathione S-transferase
MPEIVLHHYPQSPVSEKVRVALGIKGLTWRSVTIPRLPPKPDLMPLTGGYRLTPVMQIGTDIFCDSQGIVRELERRFPEPTLFPGGADGLAWGVSRWTDGDFFTAAIAVVFADAGAAMPADFQDDRGLLYFGPGFEMAKLQADMPERLASLRAQFGWIEERLATGRRFMLGEDPGLPDALCYYLAWFLRGRYSKGPEFLARFPKLCAWEERVKAIGHGTPSEMSGTEALDIAKASDPAPAPASDPDDPTGLKPGDAVAVHAEGVSGTVGIAGRIRHIGIQDIVLDREDPRVGPTAIHFPRVGYRIART